MKKKTQTLLIGILAASMLFATGCGEKNAETESAQTETTAGSESTSSAETTAETETAESAETEEIAVSGPVDIAEADFDRILDRCEELLTAEDIDEIWSDEKDAPFLALYEKRMTMEPEEALSGIGYTYMDLNEDGDNELLIAAVDDDSDMEIYGNQIYAVFTKDGNGSRTLFYGWGRNRYYYTGNGFINEGSSGAGSYNFGKFAVEGSPAEIVWEKMYFTADDPDTVYSNETGEFDPSVSVKEQMTGDELLGLETETENGVYTVSVCAFLLRTLPVTITTPDQTSVAEDACKQVVIDDTEYATQLICAAQEKVTDFKVFRLTVTDADDDGNLIFDSEQLYEQDELAPGNPLDVKIELLGDMPDVGISYTDAGGNPVHVIFSISGYDGSLYQEEQEF